MTPASPSSLTSSTRSTREIVTARGKTPAISGILEDGSARLHFTAWVDIPDIFTTKAIIARDVYVKSFHGMPSININEKTVLEEYQGVVEPYVRQPRSLGDLSGPTALTTS